MLGSTVAISVLLLIPATPPAEDTSFWLLAEVVPSPKPAPVQGEGFYTIVEDNPRLKGDVIIDDRRLFFRLSRGRQVLWERPLPSTFVRIPADADIVVMIGLRYGEYGIRGCGFNVPEHLWVFDARGKELVAQPDTGPVSWTHLFPDGRFAYLTTDSIRLLDLVRGGEEIWRIEGPWHSFEVLDEGRFLTTRTWLQETDESVTALYDVESGRLLKSFRMPFDSYPWVFAISSDGLYAFVRTIVQHPNPRANSPVPQGPLLCDVRVYRIGQWQEPLVVFEAMPAAPVYADRRPSDGAVAMLVRERVDPKPRTPLSIVARLEIRDAAGKPVFGFPLKRGRDDYYRRSVRFEGSGSEARVLFAEMEYRFLHLGGEIAESSLNAQDPPTPP